MQLDGVNPFALYKFNSSKTRDDVLSVIVLKKLKYVPHSLAPTLLSRELRIRLRHKSGIKSSLKSRRRKIISIRGSRNPSRSTGLIQDRIKW